jgi:hypothetical protein
MVSDIVLLEELPEEIKESVQAYSACVSGALQRDDYLDTIREVGFQDVRVETEKSYKLNFDESDTAGQEAQKTILSASVSAIKPD